MFGQLCEPLPARPDGAWLPCAGAVRVVVVPVPLLDVVVLLLDAALAIAAPPPTRAPVTTRVVIAGFSLRIVVHLLSSGATTLRADRRSAVGAT
jgi:hypothetical protein